MQRIIFKEFVDKVRARGIPEGIQMDCTYRCNLNCRHCYQSKDTKSEPTFNDVKKWLLQFKKIGCLELVLSGGEPFLRKDFLEIISFAREQGFAVAVLSNGTLIDKQCARELSRLKLLYLQISLYGSKPQTHDFTTQIKGSFKKTMRAIHLMQEYNIKFKIAFIVMRHNFREVQELKSIAKRNKWRANFDYMVFPTQDRKLFPLRYRISDYQARQALADVRIRRKFISPIPIKRSRFLSVARSTAYIAPDGEVYPFCTVRIPCGNLREHSFEYIWQNSSQLRLLRKLRIEDLGCFRCKYFRRCHWCTTVGWLEHGDLTARPKENCRFFKIALDKERRDEV